MSLFGIISGIGALAGLFRKDRSGKAIKEATAAQIASQERGMKVYEQLMREAMRTNLASGMSTAQTQYDLARAVNQQNQGAMLPYQLASLSALQALPQLQQLLGIDAYAIPTTVSQTGLPSVDMMGQYEAMVNRLGHGMPYVQQGSYNAGEAPFGGGMSYISPATTNTSLRKLAPTPDLSYAIKPSPLYDWQLRESTRGLNNQLASSGLSGSTYAQRELGRRSQDLAAQERERLVKNLQWLAELGYQGRQNAGNMGVPSIGNLAGGQERLISDLAAGLGQGYAGIGAAQARGGLAYAQNQANRPDPFGQLMSAAWMLGGGDRTLAPTVSPYARYPTIDMSPGSRGYFAGISPYTSGPSSKGSFYQPI